MADIYLRQDGTAPTRVEAVGPETDVSKCMTIAAYKAGTKQDGDVLYLSDLGGDFTDNLPVYANDVEHRNIGNGNPHIVSSTNEAVSAGAGRSGTKVISSGTGSVGGEANQQVFTISNLNDVELSGNNWNITNGNYVIRSFIDAVGINASNFKMNNNNLVASSETTAMFRCGDFGQWKVDNIEIKDNTMNGGQYMYYANGTAGQGVASSGFMFTDNYAENIDYDIVITGQGVSWDGTEANRSIIARNTCINAGTMTTPNVNAFGLQWCTGVICEDNIVNGVLTSVPDGNGYIVDWAFKDNGYLSDQVILRRNKATGCNSALQTAGINIFKGTNTLAHCNELDNNSVGVKIVNEQSNGSLLANNTLVGNTLTSVLQNNVSGADITGTVLTNNILVGGEHNVYIQSASVLPELNSNCYYGSTVSARRHNGTTFTAEVDAVEADPLFVDYANGDYNLQRESPCVGAGTKWWGNGPRPESLSGEPLPDTGIDLGAYQSTWDPNHPVNL